MDNIHFFLDKVIPKNRIVDNLNIRKARTLVRDFVYSLTGVTFVTPVSLAVKLFSYFDLLL